MHGLGPDVARKGENHFYYYKVIYIKFAYKLVLRYGVGPTTWL